MRAISLGRTINGAVNVNFYFESVELAVPCSYLYRDAESTMSNTAVTSIM